MLYRLDKCRLCGNFLPTGLNRHDGKVDSEEAERAIKEFVEYKKHTVVVELDTTYVICDVCSIHNAGSQVLEDLNKVPQTETDHSTIYKQYHDENKE